MTSVQAIGCRNVTASVLWAPWIAKEVGAERVCQILPWDWDRMWDLTRLADVILLIIRMPKQNKNDMKLLYPRSVSQSKNIKSDKYSSMTRSALGLNDEDTSNSYFKIISSPLSTISKANIDYTCKQGHGLTFQMEQLAHIDSCTAPSPQSGNPVTQQWFTWIVSYPAWQTVCICVRFLSHYRRV